MAKKKSKLKLAQEKAELAIQKTNDRIDFLGEKTSNLYQALTDIQEAFDNIRNIPSDTHLQYEKLKEIRLSWKSQAEKIDRDYKEACVKNTGKGAAGVGLGVGVVTLGPTAAMGIATTFGVASTGTAISTLSGAAATNAALAWLGGGALAAGGGGMAAGNAFLALAGPIGWAIAGISLLGSGLLLLKTTSDQKRRENIFTLISERDVKSYELAIIELNERITRIIEETMLLNNAIDEIATYGLDYSKMTEKQQYTLGSYVNLMNASTQLLINPILGLQAKYTEEDFDKFALTTDVDSSLKKAIVSLSNLLYKIELDDKDRMILYKSLKNNKDFLKAVELKKSDFKESILETINLVLMQKYNI